MNVMPYLLPLIENTLIKLMQNNLLGASVICEMLVAVVMVILDISIKQMQNDLLGTCAIHEVLAAIVMVNVKYFN